MRHRIQQPLLPHQQRHRIPVRLLNAEHPRHRRPPYAGNLRPRQYHHTDLLGGTPLHIRRNPIVGFRPQMRLQRLRQRLRQPQMRRPRRQRPRVGDETRLRSQNRAPIQRLQPVLPQGSAGSRQVGNQISVAGGRRRLQRAAHRHNGKIVNAPLKKITPQQPLILGRNPQLPPPLVKLQRQIRQIVHRCNIQPAVRHRQHKLAASVLQIVNNRNDRPLIVPILQQPVQPGNPHLGAALLNLPGDVGSPLKQRRHPRQSGNAAGVAPRIGPAHPHPARRQKAHRRLPQLAVARYHQSHRISPHSY